MVKKLFLIRRLLSCPAQQQLLEQASTGGWEGDRGRGQPPLGGRVGDGVQPHQRRPQADNRCCSPLPSLVPDISVISIVGRSPASLAPFSYHYAVGAWLIKCCRESKNTVAKKTRSKFTSEQKNEDKIMTWGGQLVGCQDGSFFCPFSCFYKLRHFFVKSLICVLAYFFYISLLLSMWGCHTWSIDLNEFYFCSILFC